MAQQEPSKTALAVAALRAVHQLVDAPPRILDDTVVTRLFDPAYLDQLRAHPERYQTAQSRALRAHVLVRSRYAEDCLAQAVARGVTQYAILGVGYDTFAYRQPAWAKGLHIFEVDQPASQQDKRARLQRAGISVPANVTYAPIDFETTALDVGLREAGFDFTRATFISWLGVMMYLSPAAAEAVLRFVTGLPQGSEIVFTFAQPDAHDGEYNRPSLTLAERAASHGEPWQYYITPEDLTQQLGALGFRQVSMPTPAEIDARYMRGRQDGLFVLDRLSIVSASV